LPIWTIDLAIPKAKETGKTVPEYASQVAQKLQRTNKAVRNNHNETWYASSRWYNRKAKPQAFDVGEKVRVYYPRKFDGRTFKWQSYFSTEAVVARKINDATYLVPAKNCREGKIVHVDKLKPVRHFQ